MNGEVVEMIWGYAPANRISLAVKREQLARYIK
jgi:hypothetical protein